jgi:cytoskeletal protein RodZ
MENENITPEVATNEATPAPASPVVAENKSSGALIGTIIVIVILVVGGFYLWNTRVQPKIEEKTVPPTEQPLGQQTTEDQASNADPATTALAAQSSSDETASIEADLNATDLNNMDTELQAI